MEILQVDQLLGEVGFTGTNSVGAKLQITLPKVLISPSKALSMIGDGWGEIELDGEVLVDITTGSFGQFTLNGEQAQPNVANYYIGKGIVSWNGADLGNVSKFEFTPQVKLLDHYSSRLGIKVKDLSVVQEKSAKLLITMDEWTTANLQLVLMGQ